MVRRQLERRFKKSIIAVGSLYALATILAPEQSAPVEAPSSKGASHIFAATLWRPAGAVFNRKTDLGHKTTRPWSVDTSDRVPRATLTRLHRIFGYASRYSIPTDLSRTIYDVALQQKIEPELAFRLVRLESEFKTTALSPVGAIGLTQLMLPTAREFEPGVTREGLMDAETNLRIGFKYLRALIRENKGNLSLALLVYNRGPVAVQLALSQGLDPTNGYDRLLMKGYRGRGVIGD
jgi:hypothetical protein